MTLLVAQNMPSTDVLNEGWSPLTYAAYYGHTSVARALVDAGCISTAPDQVHPYDVATSGQNEEMSVMLFPFWHGGAPSGKEFEPPVPYEPRS
jgi:ankyrin repeat protein